MTMMTMMTTMRMTTDSKSVDIGVIVTSRCPACGRNARFHTESVRRGAEILCSECSAILRIDSADPLTLYEIDEEDLL